MSPRCDLLDDGVREYWPGVSLFCLFLVGISMEVQLKEWVGTVLEVWLQQGGKLFDDENFKFFRSLVAFYWAVVLDSLPISWPWSSMSVGSSWLKLDVIETSSSSWQVSTLRLHTGIPVAPRKPSSITTPPLPPTHLLPPVVVFCFVSVLSFSFHGLLCLLSTGSARLVPDPKWSAPWYVLQPFSPCGWSTRIGLRLVNHLYSMRHSPFQLLFSFPTSYPSRLCRKWTVLGSLLSPLCIFHLLSWVPWSSTVRPGPGITPSLRAPSLGCLLLDSFPGTFPLVFFPLIRDGRHCGWHSALRLLSLVRYRRVGWTLLLDLWQSSCRLRPFLLLVFHPALPFFLGFAVLADASTAYAIVSHPNLRHNRHYMPRQEVGFPTVSYPCQYQPT